MQRVRMLQVATVCSTFHARVIAARLGAEGFVTELRGNVDGMYPTAGDVHVYVGEDDLEPARELLLADDVESAFEPSGEVDGRGPGARRWWVLVAAVAVLVTIAFSRAV